MAAKNPSEVRPTMYTATMLTPTQRRAVEQAARREERSISAVIRRAVERYVREPAEGAGT